MTTFNGHLKEAAVATRTIPISEAKAKLLALVTEIGDTGDEIVLTRRGRPVARLTAVSAHHSVRGALILPDDMAAYDLSAEWHGSDLA